MADGLYTDGQVRSRASLPTLWRALVTQLSKTQDAFSDGDSSVPTLLHKGSLESRGVSLLEKHGDPSRGCSHLPAAAQLWAAGSHGGLMAGNLAGEGPFPLPAQPSRGGRGSEGVSVGGAKGWVWMEQRSECGWSKANEHKKGGPCCQVPGGRGLGRSHHYCARRELPCSQGRDSLHVVCPTPPKIQMLLLISITWIQHKGGNAD